MTEKQIHLTGRIDQVVRDYFQANNSQNKILAKNLMPLFVEKDFFRKDEKNDLLIRSLLRELGAENKLSLLKHVEVVRNTANRNWYFVKRY